MRSVAAEWAEPMSSASPIPCATSAIRRWINAFISTSLDLGVSLNEGVHLVACQLDDFARLTDAQAHHARGDRGSC